MTRYFLVNFDGPLVLLLLAQPSCHLLCRLTTSGVEQSKGHTGQGSLGESMLETVTLMPADSQQQQ